ncbi:tripartite motif-containing protein 2-like [Anneissia japonica]|uniref:tripartite motif-containing protein 2-like n=1 Tax=Anneissia japonica TaxID=1529436 RepID=UPI0014254E82|nr:tripartite motif-containing protein 2-like [Anneissia japonica]
MASCGGNPFLSDENVGLGLEGVSSNPFEEGSTTRPCPAQPPPRPSRPPSQLLPPSSQFPASSPLTLSNPSDPGQVGGLFGGPSNDDQDEFSERFLTCTICLETYNETPKLLPCMHSFCCGCIQKLAQDKRKFACPVCRREVQVPRQGVSALPNNIFVRDLTDFLSEQPNRPRVSSTVPALESHSVTQRPRARTNEPKIDRHASGNIFQRAALRLKLQFSSKKRRNCQYHSEKELKYYCSTCHIIVCKKCIRYEHEDGHMILNLSSAAEDRLHAINSLMFEAESRVSPLEHGRDEVNAQLQSLKERHMKTKSEICDAFDSIKLFIQQQETACLTKLNMQYQRKQSLLSSQLNNLDLKLSTIKSACTFTKRTVNDLQNADYEMVAMSFQLSARIEEVLAMQTPDFIKPAADDVLEVHQDVETMNSVRSLIKEMVTVQES